MIRQRLAGALASILLVPAVIAAQTTPKAAAYAWKAAHEQQILQEFTYVQNNQKNGDTDDADLTDLHGL